MEEYGQGYTLHFDNISIGREETINDLGQIEVYPIPYHFLKSLKITSLSSEVDFTRSSESLDFEVWHPNPSFYKVTFLTPLVPPSEEPRCTSYFGSPQRRDFATLVLSQAYHPGRKAYKIFNELAKIFPFIFEPENTLIQSGMNQAEKKLTHQKGNPSALRWGGFIFGEELKNHALVNNWANGWRIGDWSLAISHWSNESKQLKTNDQQPTTIYLFFWPQLLQYLGFGLLVGIGLWLFLVFHNKNFFVENLRTTEEKTSPNFYRIANKKRRKKL